MLEDTDRLMNTVEQVLKAGETGVRKASRSISILPRWLRMRREGPQQLPSAAWGASLSVRGKRHWFGSQRRSRRACTAVSNILDNAIKYSQNKVDVSVLLTSKKKKNVWCCEYRTAAWEFRRPS
jgi:hypothetical protein